MVAKAARLVASRDLARGWTSWFEAYLRHGPAEACSGGAGRLLAEAHSLHAVVRRDWTATRHMGERQGQANYWRRCARRRGSRT